ncbi:MAG: hypothetical protein ACNA76_08080 [Anaerosomatales bacterium]|nr:hypothetical protein [Coriobacteriia bacterium]
MALRVVLDACVLYPVALRDSLLRLAELDLLQIVWSMRILDEMRLAILRHFPADACEPYGIEVIAPDDLLCRLLESSAPTVVRMLRQFSDDTSNPAMSVNDVLKAVGRSAPLFAQRARTLLTQLGE